MGTSSVRNAGARHDQAHLIMAAASLFLAALLLMVAQIAHGSPAANDDLDGDGKPDELSISPVNVLEDGSSSLDVVIRASKRAAPIRADLRSQTPSLQAYISHGALIVDRSQSSRDAAELSYEVFLWDARRRHLCLHAAVNGTPPNQLHGDWLPRDVEVSRYAPCTVLGQKTPAVPVADKAARELALSEARKLKKTDPVPDYLAFELAAQVDEGTVSSINDIGYYQEQAGFLRQALIILSAVNDRFPRRAVAKLNLTNTYWKLGELSTACQLYQQYLTSAPLKDGPARQRAVDRSVCGR